MYIHVYNYDIYVIPMYGGLSVCEISLLNIKELSSVEQVRQYGFSCDRIGTYREAGKGGRMLKNTFGR